MIDVLKGTRLTIRVKGVDLSIEVSAEEVTNFSLAARKAWETAPGRRVGRRKGTRLCDRVSVTLRLDRDLWQDFRSKESSGIIEDRTATINAWLREKLAQLAREER
jgi:hypothetical protein